MTRSRPFPRTHLAALASAAMAVAGFQLLAPPAADANAAGTDLVIREVYPGGGSINVNASYKTDFVELYNPTASPLPLAGLSLQYRQNDFNGMPANVDILALPNEVVPANDSYLVDVSPPAPATPGGADLPTPDFESDALVMGQTNGQVMLVDGVDPITDVGNAMQNVAGVVDFVGWGTSNSSETSPTTGTGISDSVSRSATGTDTDSNLADFTAGAPTPVAASGDTTPQPLAAADPGDRTGKVGTAIAAFDLQATGGTGPYSWSATGLPAGVTVSAAGHVSGTPTVAGAFNVTATVTDSAGSPATDSAQFTLTIAAASKTPSTTAAKVKPKKPSAGQKVKLKVTVKADDGSAVTGEVKIKIGKKKKTVTLKNGKAKVSLGKFGKGKHTVKVVYLGSDTVDRSKDKVTFKVV